MKLKKEEELKTGFTEVKVNKINVEQREIKCALHEKDNDYEKKRLEDVKKSLDEEKRGIEQDLLAWKEKVAQNESTITLKKKDLEKKYEEFKNSQIAQLE